MSRRFFSNFAKKKERMDYEIKTDNLYKLIDEEVSRRAAAAYAEDNTSMYDAIVLHSNDAGEVSRLISDSIDSILTRLAKIARYDSTENKISFYVPDKPSDTDDAIRAELSRFISLDVCAGWFRQRANQFVEEYAGRAAESLTKIVQLLYTRKAPSRE